MAIILRNGKNLEECMSVLRCEKERTGKKVKFSYWKINDYFSRMEEAFGIGGFRVQYNLKEPFVLPNGQIMLNCECEIGLYGECGDIVHSVMGCGTWELKKTQDGEGYKDFANDAYNAQTSAFKGACKMLNIFCALSTEEDGENSSNNSSIYHKEGSEKNKQGGTNDKGKPIEFYLNSSLVVTKEDNGKPVYELTAYKMVNSSKCEETPSTIVFFPNRYSTFSGSFDKLLNLDSSFTYRVVFNVKDGRRGGYVCFDIGGIKRCGKR